jgi:hypothetical protein
LYVTCKLYRPLTAFNISRQIVPFHKYCHNLWNHRKILTAIHKVWVHDA